MKKEDYILGKDLISVKDLKKSQAIDLFNFAGEFLDLNSEKPPRFLDDFRGYILINFFLEPSTRTRISFEAAADRLGMKTINFAPSDSSINKEETIGDTIRTLYAMHPDFLVIRTKQVGLPKTFSESLTCSVINAGDGDNEHPTQALLDAASIYGHQMVTDKKKFEEITVTICGDIKHSRVARSNIYLLKTLGVNLRICGPKELMPPDIKDLKFEISEDFEELLETSDYVMMLRYQLERMEGEFSENWIEKYRLTQKRLAGAKKGIMVLHPGPINPKREIEFEVAYGDQSLITQQISMGVAMRMAILSSLNPKTLLKND